jgi:membrane-bound lytic murein transglycosylase C
MNSKMSYRFLFVGVAALLLLLVTPACNKYQVARIATSKNPRLALRNSVAHSKSAYRRNPLLLARDIRNLKRHYRQLLRTLRGRVKKRWGKKETVTASRKRYVKYTQNYKSRAIINFDSGLIVVETVDRNRPAASLHNAIVTTLLTPGDPRAVDLYTARQVKLSGTPWLHGLVRDQHGRIIQTTAQADSYASHLVTGKHTRMTRADGKQQPIHSVSFSMVRNHEAIQAKRYRPAVSRFSRKFGISRNIVYSVIKTESDFNPFAVSSAPAYGLMQLVPHTAGRDAYRKIKGKDWIPTSSYLFNTTNNIELGTGYLGMVYYKYLAGISNPLSREYCMIAAYNTGSGNVLRTFSRNRKRAIAIINRLKPAAVYWKLKTQLNSREARRYLVKVMKHRKQFVNF